MDGLIDLYSVRIALSFHLNSVRFVSFRFGSVRSVGLFDLDGGIVRPTHRCPSGGKRQNPVLVKGVRNEPKGDRHLGLFVAFHDVVRAVLRDEVIKGGGDKGRKHGRSQTVLDGRQSLVHWQKGTPAAADRSADDGPKDGDGKLGGGNGGRRDAGKERHDVATNALVKDNDHGLKNNGEFQDFPQAGDIGVDQIRRNDGDRVGIDGQRDGDFVQKNGDQNSATRAGQGQVDELVGGRGVGLEFFEYLAAVHKGVSEHAHVFL